MTTEIIDDGWKVLAVSGVCPECNQPMPAKTDQEINEWVSEFGEDTLMSCERCGIDYMLDYGWNVTEFDHYCKGSLDTPAKRKYVEIMAECNAELQKQWDLWHANKISREHNIASCKQISKAYADKFLSAILNFKPEH